MTLQIKGSNTISGIPVKRIRGFFRHVVGWHHDSFDLPWLQEQLSLDERSATALAFELVARGYAEPPHDGAYKLTNIAEELVRASAAGQVKRKTAEAALEGLLQRVKVYNSDTNKILTIEAVVVFGSFLGSKEKLGDLDVALKRRDRNVSDGDRAKTALAYARRSGRCFGTFLDELCWADVEMGQILKARKRTIRIQDWHSFLGIAAKNPDGIQYTVVFGNSEEVTAEIRARAKRSTLP
jgi:hypothetical protein